MANGVGLGDQTTATLHIGEFAGNDLDPAPQMGANELLQRAHIATGPDEAADLHPVLAQHADDSSTEEPGAASEENIHRTAFLFHEVRGEFTTEARRHGGREDI